MVISRSCGYCSAGGCDCSVRGTGRFENGNEAVIKMKRKWMSVLLFLYCCSSISVAQAGARLSIAKGGEKPQWVNLATHTLSNPAKLPITGYGDWARCEAYYKPHLASAFVRCFTSPTRNGASVGAYCDVDNTRAWKPRRERLLKSELHLDAGDLAGGWLTVTLDCQVE